jgi:hypothetical protein
MSGIAELGGLSCKADLPLRWSLLPDNKQETSAAEKGGLSQSSEQNNLNRLQVILGLDESARELHEDDSGVAAEIQRLDFKMNVLLELVSCLITTDREGIETCSVSLSPRLILWDAWQEPPPEGARITVELFLDLRFPFPLILHGCVAALSGSAPCQVRVVLDPFSEALQEMLEKFIFRCHRRHIARLKKSST